MFLSVLPNTTKHLCHFFISAVVESQIQISSEHDFSVSVKFAVFIPSPSFPSVLCHQNSSSQMSSSDPYRSGSTPPLLILTASSQTELHDWCSEVSESTPLNCFLSFLGIYVKPIVNRVIPLSPSVTAAPPLFLSVAY